MAERFLSSFTNRIDAKGRVSVPAPFRAILANQDITDLYALRALRFPAMDVGGPDFLEAIEERIAAEDPVFGMADDISFYAHGGGLFLKPDGQGRVVITDFIREHTGISEEVAFVGRRSFFQMWDPARLVEHAAASRQRLIARTYEASTQSRPE